MLNSLRRLPAIGAGLLLATAIAFADETPPMWQMVDKTPPGPMPGEPILGKTDAPLTIIEYASLTCPHCARFDAQTLPKLRQDWIDPGKAKLVFRDFPLDGLALRVAALTRCVPPSRYFDYIDTLFEKRDSWVTLGDKGVARAASLGGLSEAEADACLADSKRLEAIAATRATAEKEYGVDSTPTFFIDGMKVEGAYPYEDSTQKDQDFKSALETAFARSSPGGH